MYFRCYYSKRNDVNQLCRFLSWTEKMNRCYWCILGLQAHTIIIFRCNQLLYGRVLSGNTVHHFWRSSIYYSFSTQIWSFERDREADTDSRNKENHVCGCNQLLYGTGPFWKYRRSLSKELDLLLILNTSTHFSNTFKICTVNYSSHKNERLTKLTTFETRCKRRSKLDTKASHKCSLDFSVCLAGRVLKNLPQELNGKSRPYKKQTKEK